MVDGLTFTHRPDRSCTAAGRLVSSLINGDGTFSITFRTEIVPSAPIEGDVSICFGDALATNPLLRGEA